MCHHSRRPVTSSENVTQLLHRLTSYEPGREWDEAIDDERIVRDLEVNDWNRLPWWHKRYDESLERVPLPRDLPPTEAAATAVLAGVAQVPDAPIDLGPLGRLLHLSAGVVRVSERRGRRIPFRAAGSAGARFPLEVYVAIPAGGGLPPGVHWYHPNDHAFVTVGPPPLGEAPAVIVTGVPWRTGWRYRERGFRHVYWDAGTMLAQQLALADSAGIATGLYSRFPDAVVTELVGADGVHEFPVAVLSLADGDPALTPTGRATSGEVDGAPLEFPLVTAAQHAADVDGLGPAWSRGEPVAAAEGVAGGEPVEEVILRRGSQRLMDPGRALPRELLVSSMAAALRGVDVSHWVAVHGVYNVKPGLYRWPELDAPVRPGSLRDEVYRICLDQGLGRDAAFVVIAATDVTAVSERGYREAQLAAGVVEGRLHLMAYALGAAASGMTFMDSEVSALLGERVHALLFTCVGVPEYVSGPGGRPGSPAIVRQVVSR